MLALKSKTSAGIQYLGRPGVSQSCLAALQQLFQFGHSIQRARLLSAEGYHAFVLLLDDDQPVAIKGGFTSGYPGEGARALADALALLDLHRVHVDEIIVAEQVMRRLNASALFLMDVENVLTGDPVRPQRWRDYIYDFYRPPVNGPHPWSTFPTVLPLALIHPLIADLALAFPSDADKALLDGFRRLEDLVRGRTGIQDVGARLFSQAFQGQTPKLKWREVRDPAEQSGRAQLFSGTFLAFRNPRAHQERRHAQISLAREFMLLNTLFCLMDEAVSS
jgi:uncharacterized protein (TIGR02391 family)